MTFDCEHQMLNPAEQWLRSQGLATKREFSTPWGICDLVGCSLDEARIRERLALGQSKPIGTQIRVMILSRIPDQGKDRSITLPQLQNEFAGFLDRARITIEVNHLVKDKFVEVTPQGGFQKLNGWVPLHKKIVALELKLARINDALHQAICNREFADASFVGLPMETAQRLIRSKKESEFSRKGIGLLAINPKACTVLLKPNPIKSFRNQILQMHCVERFWRTRGKGAC